MQLDNWARMCDLGSGSSDGPVNQDLVSGDRLLGSAATIVSWLDRRRAMYLMRA
jgi:hypothetical protein